VAAADDWGDEIDEAGVIYRVECPERAVTTT
jgi:hypothetical protein